MELKPTAKRTGDLTHYEKKLEEHVLELQEAVRIYNKTVRLYTTRSQESPYNFIGKIIPIRPMASMEMDKLIQTDEVVDIADQVELAGPEITATVASNPAGAKETPNDDPAPLKEE